MRILGALARGMLTAVLPAAFVAAAVIDRPVLDWTGRETCQAQWCQNGRDNAYMETEYRSMVDAQLAELGCDRVKRLAPRVAVRPVEGETGVVQVLTFDEAWKQAEVGAVWVEGYCG